MEARRRPIPPPIVTSSSGRPKSVPGPLPSQPGCGPTSPATPSPTSPKSFPSVSSGIRAITATWSPSLRRKSTRFPKTNLHSGYQAAVQRSVSQFSDASDSNRHSLATISDFLGRGSGDRGYTLPAFRSSQTGDPSVRNELLDSVQTAIVQLFQKKRLATELHILQESVRRLTKSESGPLIYDYFKDKLLRKGMVILRESMKNQMGAVLLEKLGQQWTHFYTVILPLLQAILYPLPMADLPIRETCLVEFRDTVVLKINLMETLEFPDVEVSPFIEQMLLVLQSVQDSHPPNKNYLRLEKLVARVVVPYLGHAGLYDGHVEPEAASQCDAGEKDTVFTDSPMEQNKPDESSGTKSASLASLALPRHVLQKHSHLRQNSAHNIAATLAPVAEHDSIRRHSIALEQVS